MLVKRGGIATRGQLGEGLLEFVLLKQTAVLTIHSMIIRTRPIEEVFMLADTIAKTHHIVTDVELRSCRHPQTDKQQKWSIAHHNSSFDILNTQNIQQVNNYQHRYGCSLRALSVYCDLEPKELPYARQVLYNAATLATDRIIVRFLGSINRSCSYEPYLDTLQQLLQYADFLHTLTNKTIIIGIEIHQGTWPHNLQETKQFMDLVSFHIPRHLQQYLGIIDDPANRYIVGKEDNEKELLDQLAPYIVHLHLKNVKQISTPSRLQKGNFQCVGKQQFSFDNKQYQWTSLHEGSVVITKAYRDFLKRYARSVEPGVSTEYVVSTENFDQALSEIRAYLPLIAGGEPYANHLG